MSRRFCVQRPSFLQFEQKRPEIDISRLLSPGSARSSPTWPTDYRRSRFRRYRLVLVSEALHVARPLLISGATFVWLTFAERTPPANYAVGRYPSRALPVLLRQSERTRDEQRLQAFDGRKR